MPALHLELEIDGEIYPELYAALAALSSASGRGERLRQLAASGLIWERVRVQGPSSLAGPAPLTASTPVPLAAPQAPAVERRLPQPVETSPIAADDGFIDLALDAPPARRFDPALHALPVLLDVVASADEPAVDADEAPPTPTATVMVMPSTAAPRSRLIRMKERGLFKNG